MMQTLLPLMPIYALILLGFVATRLNYFPASGLGVLSQFTLKICLPVLVASAVARVGSFAAFNWWFVLAYAASSLAMLAGAMAVLRHGFGLGHSRAWTVAMGAAVSNSLFLGYPTATVYFPDLADRLMAWAMTVENMVVIPTAVTMAAIFDRDESLPAGRAVAQTARRTLTNPVVVGLLAGFVLLATGWQLPWAVDEVRSAIVSAAPLLALFLVGGLVASAPAGAMGLPVAVIGLAKLVLHPALTFALMSVLPGIPREVALGGVLFAGMPMFAAYTVFAARYGGEYLSASALVATTVLGAVSVSLLVLLLA